MQPERNIRGFSTLELLVSLGILSIVTVQVLGMISTQQRQATAHREVVDVQEDARLVSEVMIADIRMAGFMVPTIVGLSSIDGGNAASDVVCMSDSTFVDPTVLASSTGRFSAATLTSTLGGNSTSAVMGAADLDIDGDGDGDFAVDSGIIVSDGSRSHCARITNIAGGTITFTPATPGGFSAAAGAARAAPAVVYEVNGSGLWRNNMLFSSQIEDVQIEFGVDLDGDGALTGAEFPVHSLDGSSPDLVRSLRLSVVAQTTRDDLGFVGGGLPQLANRNAGAADTFRRRVVISTVSPRNFF